MKAPKIIHDMPFSDYLAHPGVNASFLKDIRATSPYAAKWRKDNEEDDDTPSRVLFRAVHAAILEGDDALAAMGLRLCDVRRDPRSADFKGWLSMYPGAVPLTKTEHTKLARIRQSAVDQNIAKWLGKGDGEVTILYHDDEYDLDCKARLDWLGEDDGGAWIGDVKNTGGLDLQVLQKLAIKNGYHIQCAHYDAAVRACGTVSQRFSHLWIAGKAPHEMLALPVSEAFMAYGYEERDKALCSIADARTDGIWRTAADRMIGMSLDLPPWASSDDDVTDLGLTGLPEMDDE